MWILKNLSWSVPTHRVQLRGHGNLNSFHLHAGTWGWGWGCLWAWGLACDQLWIWEPLHSRGPGTQQTLFFVELLANGKHSSSPVWSRFVLLSLNIRNTRLRVETQVWLFQLYWTRMGWKRPMPTFVWKSSLSQEPNCRSERNRESHAAYPWELQVSLQSSKNPSTIFVVEWMFTTNNGCETLVAYA